MSLIPASVLSKLYNRTSLRNTGSAVQFSVKNRLSPAVLKRVNRLEVDGQPVELDRVQVAAGSDASVPADAIAPRNAIDFPLGAMLVFSLEIDPLDEGTHDLAIVFESHPFGELKLAVSDRLNTGRRDPAALPRDASDDYGAEIIRARQAFIRERTGAALDHVSGYSFDPGVARGNIENFTGVAQVPLGFAGPLLVHGQHAQGEFYVPLAASEGTLVAFCTAAGASSAPWWATTCSARRLSCWKTRPAHGGSPTGWASTMRTSVRPLTRPIRS